MPGICVPPPFYLPEDEEILCPKYHTFLFFLSKQWTLYKEYTHCHNDATPFSECFRRKIPHAHVRIELKSQVWWWTWVVVVVLNIMDLPDLNSCKMCSFGDGKAIMFQFYSMTLLFVTIWSLIPVRNVLVCCCLIMHWVIAVSDMLSDSL